MNWDVLAQQADDLDHVLAAVRHNGLLLRKASERLRSHHDVVQAAVSNRASAINLAAADLQRDAAVITAAKETAGSYEELYKLVARSNRVLRQRLLERVEKYAVDCKWKGQNFTVLVRDDAKAAQIEEELLIETGLQESGLCICAPGTEFLKRSDGLRVLPSRGARSFEAELQEPALLLPVHMLSGKVGQVPLRYPEVSGWEYVKEYACDCFGYSPTVCHLQLGDVLGVPLTPISQWWIEGQDSHLTLVVDQDQYYTYWHSVLQQDGMRLGGAPEDIQAQPSMVHTAVRQNGLALQFATPVCRASRRIVQAAVEQNGFALQWASAPLRGNANVVEAAVQQEGLALQFAASELRSTLGIAISAVQQNGLALEWVSPTLIFSKHGKHIVYDEALDQSGFAIAHVPEHAPDFFVAAKAVLGNVHSLGAVNANLKDDFHCMRGFIEIDPLSSQYASDRLQRDPGLAAFAVRQILLTLAEEPELTEDDIIALLDNMPGMLEAEVLETDVDVWLEAALAVPWHIQRISRLASPSVLSDARVLHELQTHFGDRIDVLL